MTGPAFWAHDSCALLFIAMAGSTDRCKPPSQLDLGTRAKTLDERPFLCTRLRAEMVSAAPSQ